MRRSCHPRSQKQRIKLPPAALALGSFECGSVGSLDRRIMGLLDCRITAFSKVEVQSSRFKVRCSRFPFPSSASSRIPLPFIPLPSVFRPGPQTSDLQWLLRSLCLCVTTSQNASLKPHHLQRVRRANNRNPLVILQRQQIFVARDNRVHLLLKPRMPEHEYRRDRAIPLEA